jgi:hypothetical protein
MKHLMTMRRKIAFGVAGIVVVSVVTWFLFTATGQGNNDVTVCVGPDSVLRSPESGICPAGTEKISLSRPDIKKVDNVDENDPLGPTKEKESELDQRLAELEKRVGNLENSALFEVVNQKGDVIFSVAPGKVQLYHQDKTAVAAMLATSEGGEFVARSGDGNLSTFLGAYGERAGLRITEGDNARLDLLRQPGGNYSLRIRSGSGDIAGIGESQAGTGALVVGDKGGQHKAAMQVDAGKGVFNIFNDNGRGVASLTQSVNGGGMLVLTDGNSNARVMMGNNDNRYGVVMTFPTGFPYVPKSGLPGSYMLGCAGGPACVP